MKFQNNKQKAKFKLNNSSHHRQLQKNKNNPSNKIKMIKNQKNLFTNHAKKFSAFKTVQ